MELRKRALDPDEVRRIAFLARIRISEDALGAVAEELSQIMGWIERLGEVDTGTVAPMASVVDIEAPWRDDAVTDGDCRDRVLANAPEPEGGFFAVPKVVE